MVLQKYSLCGNARSDHEQMYLPSAVTLLSRFVRDVRNNSTNLFQTIYPINNSPIAPTIPLQVCAWRGCGTQWTFDDSPSLKTLSTARGEANKEQRTIQTISKTIIFQRVLDSFHFVSRTSHTHIHIYIYVYIYVSLSLSIYIYLYIYIYIYIYIYMRVSHCVGYIFAVFYIHL